MKFKKNFCRVLPPIIARNPCLLDEMVGKVRRRSESVTIDYRHLRRRMAERLQEELERMSF